jgi:DNA-binding SARP family transcriptional activator
VRLRVLGAFELRIDTGADTAPLLATDERRLLAALALARTPRTIGELARLLWPELPTDAALGTLAGVRDSLAELVAGSDGTLRLADQIEVDFGCALSSLREWQRDPRRAAQTCLDELVELLRQELLPGWGEGWVSQERDRFQRVRLHALETLCLQLTAAGRHEPAIRAGALVVAAEPLRESARRNLIEAHLAAGNVSEAVHQYEEFVETCAKVGRAPGAELSAFFPPSPAWPVLHVRRPVNTSGAFGRGLRPELPARRSTVGSGAVARG